MAISIPSVSQISMALIARSTAELTMGQFVLIEAAQDIRRRVHAARGTADPETDAREVLGAQL